MNGAFIRGFLDELEKRAFFGKKELRALQGKLKEIHRGLSKIPQIETISVGDGRAEEKPVRAGSVLESAKSMSGDVARRLKTLKQVGRNR